MKALVLTDYEHLEYIDVVDPSIEKDGVLVNIKACAICGSDVHGYDGKSGRRIPPVIMGHEASGVIVDVGAEVKRFSIGDRVTFDSTVYCGYCTYCKEGKVNLCDNRMVLGVSCGDYKLDGAMAELLSIPNRILYHIPDNVSFDQAAMVEPVSIAIHAIRRSPIKMGDVVVVFGTGTIGLLLIQALKIAGCSEIIAVDLDQDKLNLAKSLGATITLNPAEGDPVKKIFEITKGKGANIAYEAVGISSTINQGIDSLMKGGTLMMVGNVSPEIKFPLQKCVTREINALSTCASAGEYETCIDLISRGKINVDALISKTVPLSDGDTWFKKLHSGEPGLIKVILRP